MSFATIGSRERQDGPSALLEMLTVSPRPLLPLNNASTDLEPLSSKVQLGDIEYARNVSYMQ